MARGITQDQGNAAADTILGADENPTVEKVRAELGTGSPKTPSHACSTCGAANWATSDNLDQPERASLTSHSW
ncbi:DNA-binding protein [Luteibacter sp. E-22]|uniref:DNA-binding protein n=1 Tax=Luteibacter sp. E-22 TaxID=3404050 RepID=UPI003CE7C599